MSGGVESGRETVGGGVAVELVGVEHEGRAVSAIARLVVTLHESADVLVPGTQLLIRPKWRRFHVPISKFLPHHLLWDRRVECRIERLQDVPWCWPEAAESPPQQAADA